MGRQRRSGAAASGWEAGGFAVLQGRRLLWWRSEGLLEAGEPAGALLDLTGRGGRLLHVGLTPPSPADLLNGGPHVAVVFAIGAPSGGGGPAFAGGLQGPATGSKRAGGAGGAAFAGGARHHRWALAFAEEAERRAFVKSVEASLAKRD